MNRRPPTVERPLWGRPKNPRGSARFPAIVVQKQSQGDPLVRVLELDP